MAPPIASPPHKGRTLLVVVAAVVVLVVIVVAALALTGVLTGSKSSGGSGGTTSFSASRTGAQNAANGYQGGGWNLIGAFGSASTTTQSSPVANLTSALSASCTFTAAAGLPASFSLGATSSVSSGEAGAWVFAFTTTSGSTILLVANLGGSTTILGTLGGSSCFGGALGLLTPISTVVDSTAAADAANAAGGSAFLSAHTAVWGSYSLLAGVSFLGFTEPSEWTITYSTCPISGGSAGSGSAFSAVVFATNGTVHSTNTTAQSCSGLPGSSGTPIGSALALASPLEAATGAANYYNFSVQSTAAGLLLSNLGFQVVTPGGSVVPPTGFTLTVNGISGTPVGVYTIASSTPSWSYGGSTAISASMTITLTTPVATSLSGDTLQVLGSGSYTGMISITIP